MSTARRLAVGGILLVVGGLTLMTVSVSYSQSASTLVSPIPLPSTLSGVVISGDEPVADAIVQIQGTPIRTESAEDGAFTFSGIEGTTPITITAWSEGHYIGWTTVNPGASDWAGGDNLNISLRPLASGDNSEYEWFEFEGVEGSASCGICHREYEEWQNDQHSRAAINHRFLTMYTGTNMAGESGQMVQFGGDGVPLPLDPNEPHYGPGFLLDNPGRVGNCATCHTPLASTSPNTQNCSWSGCHTSLTIERANGVIAAPPRMPQFLTRDAAEGITCEFCHKVGEVYFDPQTNLPRPDMPGILSMRLYRPADDSEQVFFGTLVDVNRGDSYLPLLSESEFCAGCHHGVMGGVMGVGTMTGGVLIYSSYSEWLNSPYSDPENGMTCQDCHMLESSENWFVYPERGGLVRDYAPLHNHTMLGAADESLLQNAVTLETSAERSGDQIEVQVSITNDQTGHHIPTDAPIRSMILVVEALDATGHTLALLTGPVNPAYSGDYGGLPGRTFARVLRDNWTGEIPTAAYWRPVTIVEDTRIPALGTDTTTYTFDAPAGTEVTVNVSLVFRRALYDLMQQKGWDDPDILMEYATIQLD
jgi:hypothetical protein